MSRTPLAALAVSILCLALAAPATAARSVTHDDASNDGSPDRDIARVITLHKDKRVVVKTRLAQGSTLSDEMWHGGDPVTCGTHVAAVSDHRQPLTVTLGRRCLAIEGVTPARIRVSSFGTYETGRVTDVLPSWRAHGPWTPAA